MRGLAAIPGMDDLRGAYEQLQSTRTPIAPALLIRWTQWSRFDPRLAEQLVGHFVHHWKDLSLRSLREHLASAAWPAALGVLLSHGRFHPDLPRGERGAFSAWIGAVMSGFSRGDGGAFFVGTRAFGGRLLRLDAEQSIKPYLDWGYLGRDLLVNKPLLVRRTTHTRETRRQVLEDFIEQCRKDGRAFTTSEYREALGGGVSPRQAEMDLRGHPRLRALGRTRARVFVVAGKSSKKIRKN